MGSLLLWLGVTYSAFKFAGMVLARSPGFGRSDIGWRDRLCAREPALLLAALAVSAPLVMLMHSYSHRRFTSLYQHSVACYGRIMVLKDLPEIRKGTDGFSVYESVQGYKEGAFVTAAELSLRPEEVSRALSHSAASSARIHAAAQPPQMRQVAKEEVASALSCLHPPADPPNA